MTNTHPTSGLETKFCTRDEQVTLEGDATISGYASIFGQPDQSGDIVMPGAYARGLEALRAEGRPVRMLWQHDPTEPIGIWDEVKEDATGLYVRGRILRDVVRGREAIALIGAGVIDGLSIGYRTRVATRNEAGQRLLKELDLWEVSLVTFPMLQDARVSGKGATSGSELRELAGVIEDARRMLGRPGRA